VIAEPPAAKVAEQAPTIQIPAEVKPEPAPAKPQKQGFWGWLGGLFGGGK
jgi:hypothetical protein